MTIAVAPTQSNVQTALRSFLLAVLPGVEVVEGQDNRVPEPATANFVVMTPIRFRRLETNIDASADVRFTGSIAATVMIVSEVAFGTILEGATLFGVDVVPNTTIISQSSGTPGGEGAYVIAPDQTVSSQTLSSGAKTIEQPTEVTVQLDFHSADASSAGDMAQTVSTLMRDDYAVQQFAGQDPNYGVVPLLADDPKQMPFINDQNQYEWRWIVEARLQANQIVSVPQQYAGALAIDVVNVDATYPP